MKILTAKQIREADKYTIENEPILSLNLMERAASRAANRILKIIKSIRNYNKETIYIICGTGNNGGDGLVIARILSQKGFNVKVFIVEFSKNYSNDFEINLKRLNACKSINEEKIEINFIKKEEDIPVFKKECILIDAIFGTGLTRRISGFTAKLINIINNSYLFVISIDIPSGLFAEDNSNNDFNNIIKANVTLTFELPKLSFFFSENYQFVGDWEIVNIGLSKEFISKVESNYYFISNEIIKNLIKKRNKFSHKGDFGHTLLIGGSYGKIGAVILSVKGCLHSGTGLVTANVPSCAYVPLQSAVPEAMVICDENEKIITKSIDYSKYNAIGIGIGLGRDEETTRVIKNLIQSYRKPIVFDADALNILAENKTLIPFLPANSILTPHLKEFERLTCKSENSYERLLIAKEFAVKNNVILVLKGHYTLIATPSGNCYFNSTGNAGMATAGSGDVLTGIISSLLSQGYTPVKAALLAVYIHGLAGDYAAQKYGMEYISASNIIEGLSYAFNSLK